MVSSPRAVPPHRWTRLAALLLSLIAAAAATASGAAFPGYINYQGKLGDSSGNPLTGTYSFRFRFYTQAAGGTLLATDDNYTAANAVSVTNGLYSVQIGSLTAGGLSEQVFLGPETWLEIDVSPGADFAGAETLAPRERLAAVPYAFRAVHAEKLGAGTAIGTFTSAGNLALPYGVAAATASISGEVLIGGAASAPTYGLHLADKNLLISGSGNELRFSGPQAALIGHAGAFSTQIQSNGTVGLTLEPVNRRVGIGTSDPAAALDVSGAAQFGTTRKSTMTATGEIVSPSSITASAFFGDGSGLTGVAGSDAAKVAKAGDAMTGSLTMVAGSTITVTGSAFSVGASTFVVDGGRIGIGVDAPLRQLHIVSPGANTAAIGSFYPPMLVNNFLDYQLGIGTAAWAAWRFQRFNGWNKTMLFHAGSDNWLSVGSRGTAGIGQDWNIEPTARWHVVNSSYTSYALDISSSDTNTKLLVVRANGGVGVGTANPEAALDVYGIAQFGTTRKSTMTATGEIVSPSSITASAFFGDGSGLTGVAGSDAAKVAKAGDTMTGLLTAPDYAATYGIGAATAAISGEILIGGAAPVATFGLNLANKNILLSGTGNELRFSGPQAALIGHGGFFPTQLQTNGVVRQTIEADGHTRFSSGITASSVTLSANAAVTRGTADGADNGYLQIGGGGAADNTRGGYANFFGNEFGSGASGGIGLYPGINGKLTIGTDVGGGTVNTVIVEGHQMVIGRGYADAVMGFHPSTFSFYGDVEVGHALDVAGNLTFKTDNAYSIGGGPATTRPSAVYSGFMMTGDGLAATPAYRFNGGTAGIYRPNGLAITNGTSPGAHFGMTGAMSVGGIAAVVGAEAATLQVVSTSATAGHDVLRIDDNAGAKVFSVRQDGGVVGLSSMTASAFFGDGSNLTGIVSASTASVIKDTSGNVTLPYGVVVSSVVTASISNVQASTLTITGSLGSGSGQHGGGITILGGTTTPGSNQNGGDVTLRGGHSTTNTGTWHGGYARLVAGTGVNNGGAAFVEAGDSTGAAFGGALTLKSGAGAINGGITIKSGNTIVATIPDANGLTMAGGKRVLLSGSGGYITSASSVTASAFFGDGSGLTGVAGSDATKVAKAGDTMTGLLTAPDYAATYGVSAATGAFSGDLAVGGNITGGNGTAGSLLFLNGAAGQSRALLGQTAAVNRWIMYLGNPASETGSDAGSNFQLFSISDAGAGIDSPLVISRAAGGDILLGQTGGRKVGIGTASPAAKLHLSSGTLYVDGASSEVLLRQEAQVARFTAEGVNGGYFKTLRLDEPNSYNFFGHLGAVIGGAEAGSNEAAIVAPSGWSFMDGNTNRRRIKVYNDGLITFNSDSATASTMTAAGSLTMARDGAVTLSGPSGVFAGASSVTASAFFGDGAGITGITATDSSKVAKTGDTMTGLLAAPDYAATYGVSAATAMFTANAGIGAAGSPQARIHISSPAQIGALGQSPAILVDGDQQGRGNIHFVTHEAVGQQLAFSYPEVTSHKSFGFDSNYNTWTFMDFAAGMGTAATPQILLGGPTVGSRFGLPTGTYLTYPKPQAQVHISSGVAGRSLLIDGDATYQAIFNGTGDIGIGTVSPASKLHVLDGDVRISTTPSAASRGIIFQDGTSFNSGMRTIVVNGSGKKWSDGTFARGCYGYLNPAFGYSYSGLTGDGVYTIDPDGPGGDAQFDIYCDMTAQGGGWTLVAGIDGANRNHAVVSAVTSSNLTSSTGKGKLADTAINNIKSGVSPAFRITCAAVTEYFQSICEFRATADAAGACTAEATAFPPASYGTVRFTQSNVWGLANGSSGAANRVIYADGSASQNGCDTASGWSQSGAVYVR